MNKHINTNNDSTSRKTKNNYTLNNFLSQARSTCTGVALLLNVKTTLNSVKYY